MREERTEFEALIIGLWAQAGLGSGLLRRLALAGTAAALEVDSAAWQRLRSELEVRSRARFDGLCATLDVAAVAALGRRLERELAARQVRVVVLGESAYPSRLGATRDAPAVLSVCGEPGVLERRLVAVVGTRRASAAGLQACRELVAGLHERGLLVVSGGALGIDACAHRAALSAGDATVLVSATGIDAAYPRRNVDIYQAAVRRAGAVVSQFPPRTPPRPERFPRRNPTIAGLAVATIVVEAPHGSGALHTAQAARRQGRAVWVLSGTPFRVTSAGGHALIKIGHARLLDSLDELTHLERGVGDAAIAARRAPHISLPFEESVSEAQGSPEVPAWRVALLARLQGGACSRDELLMLLGARPDAHALLLELELSGTIERVAGGRYRLAGGAGVVKVRGES